MSELSASLRACPPARMPDTSTVPAPRPRIAGAQGAVKMQIPHGGHGWPSPARQATKESDLANSLPECHPTQHRHTINPAGTAAHAQSQTQTPKTNIKMCGTPYSDRRTQIVACIFSKGLLLNRERIWQVSSVNDVPLFPKLVSTYGC
jgi:hypothetical protein